MYKMEVEQIIGSVEDNYIWCDDKVLCLVIVSILCAYCLSMPLHALPNLFQSFKFIYKVEVEQIITCILSGDNWTMFYLMIIGISHTHYFHTPLHILSILLQMQILWTRAK